MCAHAWFDIKLIEIDNTCLQHRDTGHRKEQYFRCRGPKMAGFGFSICRVGARVGTEGEQAGWLGWQSGGSE